MTPSRTIRVLFLGSMLGSIVVVLSWAGFIAWRKWPEWRAVREMRAAVEANEPGRFLDAVEAVDTLGVAEAAAEEIAALRHHPESRVRMYAVMALTVLRPRGSAEAQQLIELFDDPGEDIDVRCAAAYCLVLFREHARVAVPSLNTAIKEVDDPRHHSALVAAVDLGRAVTGPLPQYEGEPGRYVTLAPPEADATGRKMTEFLLFESDRNKTIPALIMKRPSKSPH